eukprot:CAMPEP_0175988656 /NCGR_PEP_ID=MMETSP0108-20121206/51362_1 /TAXON_ID=195067 ORGANISM="Goniomonas pacifica, Strain CCMP1869" /NCGR_SAMPLE_ID=MMETSP0108 /ASSEMBLY_ACC=CAM_ASM_000204 /LENGTH=146 /DNA_ID=CAMNT_0017320021 /DNA_START=11 /DNA_END=451 /DNA_ORIENTATION=-
MAHPCRFFASADGCKAGDACQFSHISLPPPATRCPFWEKGHCKSDVGCPFLHETTVDVRALGEEAVMGRQDYIGPHWGKCYDYQSVFGNGLRCCGCYCKATLESECTKRHCGGEHVTCCGASGGGGDCRYHNDDVNLLIKSAAKGV